VTLAGTGGAEAGADGESQVPSPCINVCRMEAASGLCEGCLRTIDEIVAWSQMSGADKRAVWAALDARRAHRPGGQATARPTPTAAPVPAATPAPPSGPKT